MDLDYSKPYIHETALATLLGGSEDRRYSWVKRALKKGALTRLRRGMYLIQKKDAPLVDSFEIAQQVYGPSYISFESALSHHGWIPETVYTTTSASFKRSCTFKTPIGIFSYKHTPELQFFMGVERVASSDSVFLMANPWKALADYMYVYHKKWVTLADLIEDLRIDEAALQTAETATLEEISLIYESPRVRAFAKMVLKELKNGHQNY